MVHSTLRLTNPGPCAMGLVWGPTSTTDLGIKGQGHLQLAAFGDELPKRRHHLVLDEARDQEIAVHEGGALPPCKWLTEAQMEGGTGGWNAGTYTHTPRPADHHQQCNETQHTTVRFRQWGTTTQTENRKRGMFSNLDSLGYDTSDEFDRSDSRSKMQKKRSFKNYV